MIFNRDIMYPTASHCSRCEKEGYDHRGPCDEQGKLSKGVARDVRSSNDS